MILTLNGGSSSIKFACYTIDETLRLLLKGKMEGIGTHEAIFSFTQKEGEGNEKKSVGKQTMETAAEFLIDWLEENIGFEKIKAAGHRIVHGMDHSNAEEVTPDLLEELQEISAYDPDHMPAEISLIKKIQKLKPDLIQVACFDTAFHAGLPAVAAQFALPRKFWEEGIKRYGFHGLSYSYLLEALREKYGNEVANGRLVLAHLGSGCSMAAVKNGKSMDTTMGFTPVGGMMMGTRSGDLDPGIIDYLLKNELVKSEGISDLINHESGLLGISGISSDLGELLDKELTDKPAAEAIDMFCYQAKKWISAMTSVLGGLDGLVFTGGIAENAASVRLRICEGLRYLGIELDALSNESGEMIISKTGSPVKVFLIPANEEYMIAKLTKQKASALFTS
ncbi:acetate/propionate family kinase [Dyadobacter arcticus]|uniref:Acetate kinase n=1 Tax=Dyadobacter arcticus TaxID=1078754 RepID=A0ABX0UPA4_9BACT|nr:acetate/propionate family kinase [Dyadobacter arcticus]NIJ52866.1 acetate kinase [Dyadobacter arcticus]